MNKKIIISIFIGAIVIAGGILVFLRGEGNEPPKKEISQTILFYGEGCPHCAIVDEFIKENKVDEKFSFERKEVYYNKKNSEELSEKAQKCGLPTASIGVPFLWDGSNSKCLIGDKDIIDFFKQKIGS